VVFYKEIVVICLLNVWYLQRNNCYCSVSWMCGIYKEITVIAVSRMCGIFQRNNCYCSVSRMCGVYKEITVIALSPECVVCTKK
jgi:hypothetical protein